MGWYYNKGRGNLPLTLTGANSISVRGNSWIELKGADETTPSVMRARAKGLLHRQDQLPKHLRPEPVPKEVVSTKKTLPPAKVPPPKAEAVKEEVKTPVAGDEARAPAAPEPKPSTAGKSKKTSTKTK